MATSRKRQSKPTAKRRKVKAVKAPGMGDLAPMAIYAGSFDPITNGHVDLIRRSARVFPRLTVAVAYNPNKDSALFTPEERCAMIRASVEDLGDRVIADAFNGLLVDYARDVGARVLVRGLRAVSDFEFEFQMTSMNRHLNDEIETVFLMAGEQHFYTSSRLVKEVATFGGDVSELVPKPVHAALREKLGR